MVKTLTSLFITVATLASAVAGYSDNCSGSGICSSSETLDCHAAWNRYDDSTVYRGYTARVANGCTAIYRCADGVVYPQANGATLKSIFNDIYALQGCYPCGSRAVNNGQCELTLNYCTSCHDSG